MKKQHVCDLPRGLKTLCMRNIDMGGTSFQHLPRRLRKLSIRDYPLDHISDHHIQLLPRTIKTLKLARAENLTGLGMKNLPHKLLTLVISIKTFNDTTYIKFPPNLTRLDLKNRLSPWCLKRSIPESITSLRLPTYPISFDQLRQIPRVDFLKVGRTYIEDRRSCFECCGCQKLISLRHWRDVQHTLVRHEQCDRMKCRDRTRCDDCLQFFSILPAECTE